MMRTMMDSLRIRRLFHKAVKKLDGDNFFESNAGIITYNMGEDNEEYVDVSDVSYGRYRIVINEFGEFFCYKNLKYDIVASLNINKVFDCIDYKYNDVCVCFNGCNNVSLNNRDIGAYSSRKVIDNRSLYLSKTYSDIDIIKMGNDCINGVNNYVDLLEDEINYIFKSNGKVRSRKV